MARFEKLVDSPHGSRKGVEKEVNPRERAVIFDKGKASPHTAIGKFERYPR
jgi:hypothetical protein